MNNVLKVVMVLVCLVLLPQGSRAQDAKAEKPSEKQYEMKQYWMVFLKKGPNRDHDSTTAAALQRGHMENIGRLADMGKILVAGPFGDNGDIRGIFIMVCKDEAEAQQLCASDPAVKAGRLAVEVRPWWTAKGGSFK